MENWWRHVISVDVVLIRKAVIPRMNVSDTGGRAKEFQFSNISNDYKLHHFNQFHQQFYWLRSSHPQFYYTFFIQPMGFDVLFVKVKSFQAPCCLVNEEFIAIYLFPLNRLRHRNELRNLCEIGTRAHAKLISAELCAANINHSKHNYCCRSQRGTQTQQLMSSFLIIRGCQ